MNKIQNTIQILKKDKHQLPYFFQFSEITSEQNSSQSPIQKLATSNFHDTCHYPIHDANKPLLIL